MNSSLLHSLVLCETDVDGALKRFSGDETLYTTCLGAFLQDPTMVALNEAIETESWDDAFTAAHALKGLAGNMGFVPLFLATAELVVLIRAGKLKEIGDSSMKVQTCYNSIVSAIRSNSGSLQ